MFRALLAHPQEALHIQHLVHMYCVRVVSWLQPTDIIHTQPLQ
jgi:hypothetical protein